VPLKKGLLERDGEIGGSVGGEKGVGNGKEGARVGEQTKGLEVAMGTAGVSELETAVEVEASGCGSATLSEGAGPGTGAVTTDNAGLEGNATASGGPSGALNLLVLARTASTSTCTGSALRLYAGNSS